MAKPHEKSGSINEISSPVPEENDGYYDEEIVPSSCGCLWGLYSRALCGRRNIGGAHRYLLQQQQQGDQAKENWLVENFKKVREFSEVLAGPKWKNFIRSFSTCGIDKKRRGQFQYDPESYALNFDDGDINREVQGPSAAAYLHFSNAGYAASPGMINPKF